MSPPAEYLDPGSGQRFALDEPRWCGSAGGPLQVTALPGITRHEIDPGRPGLWRYAAALPLPVHHPITLGEGRTPLVRRPRGGGSPWLKCEWLMPSGSFKDRGASVMLSILRQQGITHVLEDSSGNGGAAIAAYAAAGGLSATILAPAATSPGKLLQARAYGAHVELVPGDRQATAHAALERARSGRSGFYASHTWHPFFLQGTKTLAYELWEDLGFRAPDNVVVPCGAGSNVLGCALGFGELLGSGAITRLPRIFAVQPELCAPVAAAFAAGSAHAAPVSVGPTIAEGTAIAAPIRAAEVLAALRDSGGAALSVTEAEIADATRALARDGLFVEPTAAQALAGHDRLRAAGTLAADETTVVVLTGGGLKVPARFEELLRGG